MSEAPLVIWDRWLRFSHWTVALLVMANYWWLEDDPHTWAGYAVAALLAARILWGFIGPANAQFANFWPTRARLRAYLPTLRSRHFDPAEGHNPLGALMILLLLALLALTAFSGWLQELDRFWGEDWVQLLHKIAANALVIAATVHVCGVVVMGRYTGLPLVRSMITGRRKRSSSL